MSKAISGTVLEWSRISLRSSGLQILGARFSPRHCERSEAIHSAVSGEVDCFAALAMTGERAFAFSRRLTPEVCIFVWPSSKSEGAGKTGCLLHPRSRVRFAQTKVHTSIQRSGNTPAFPAQWLYGLLRALPGERLFCHRHRRETSPPLDATTPGSGPHHLARLSSPQ